MSSIDQLHTSKYAKNSDVLMKIMAPNSTQSHNHVMYELTQSLSEAFAVLNSCGSPVFLDFDWRQRLYKSELFAGALFADPMLPPKMEDWNMEQWNGAEVFLVHQIMQTLPPFTRCGGISGGFLAA